MPRNEHAQPGQDFSEHAWDESYTLPENQFQAWHLTGDRRHFELGRRFLYDEFFAALARGENQSGTLVITGSFHTVGDAMSRLQVSPFAA